MQLNLQTCVALLSPVAVTLTTAMPANLPPGQGLKLSALPALPDPNFRYVAAYRKPDISFTASTMACVAAMRDLAFLDIDSYLGSKKSWTHAGYPGVSVTVEGEGGTRSTVRFAMWLIQAGIRDIMLRERYETSVFTGWYREVKIGRVSFNRHHHASAQGPQIAGDAVAEIHSSGFSFDLQLSSTSGSITSDDKLHVQVEHLDKAVDKRDIFFAIIWLLMTLASHHEHEPLHAFHCSLMAPTAEVRTIWNTVVRPGSEAYLLRVADLVNMLAHLAVVLLRDNKYQEMNLIISEGEVEIARGAIRTRPLPRGLAMPLTSNVTIS